MQILIGRTSTGGISPAQMQESYSEICSRGLALDANLQLTLNEHCSKSEKMNS